MARTSVGRSATRRTGSGSGGSGSGAGVRYVEVAATDDITPSVVVDQDTRYLVGSLSDPVVDAPTINEPSGVAHNDGSLELVIFAGVDLIPVWDGTVYFGSAQAPLPTGLPIGENHISFRFQEATGTWLCVAVVNDTVAPSVEFSAASQQQVVGVVNAEVDLSGITRFPVTVPYTVGGTADPDDYSVPASPLVIPSGDVNADIPVTIDATGGTIVLTLGTPLLATLGSVTVQTLSSYDPAAQDYFDRVALAGGTISGVQKSLINIRIAEMRAAGLLSLIGGLYFFGIPSWNVCKVPMLTDGNALNLVSVGAGSAYGDSDVATGLASINLEALDTGWLPSVNQALNSSHCMTYLRSDPTSGLADNGCEGGLTSPIFRFACNTGTATSDDRGRINATVTSGQKGCFIGSRVASNDHKSYRAGAQIGSTQAGNDGSDLCAFSFYLCGHNSSDVVTNTASGKNIGCAGFGDGLDATQVANLSTIIQNLMADFGLNV